MNTTNIPFSKEVIPVLMQALDVMGKGMLGIFFFMFIFYLLIKGLDKIYNKSEL